MYNLNKICFATQTISKDNSVEIGEPIVFGRNDAIFSGKTEYEKKTSQRVISLFSRRIIKSLFLSASSGKYGSLIKNAQANLLKNTGNYLS